MNPLAICQTSLITMVTRKIYQLILINGVKSSNIQTVDYCNPTPLKKRKIIQILPSIINLTQNVINRGGKGINLKD